MSNSIVILVILTLLSGGKILRAEGFDSDPVIVPLRDASHPPTIRAQMMNGGITIHGEDRKDIAVESRSRFQPDDTESRAPRADGMKRLDLAGPNGLDVKEENNVVTIKTDAFNKGGDLVVAVPRHSSLQLKCLNGGDIVVEGVEGEIEADNLNGAVTLKDVAGSIIAHSLNGSVIADLKSVDSAKPMSFSTMNGTIDVTLPSSIKANVSMKTDNGEILSDFDVKLDIKTPPIEKGRQPDGSYHVRIDKTMHGTINGGGPEYTFRSFNGQILIRKKK